MHKQSIFFLLFSLLGLSACVEEYQIPDNISELYEKELVIEGRILSNDCSVFYVSRTEPMNSFIPSTPEQDARIVVIGDDGYQSSEAINLKDAEYVLYTGPLDANVHYKVQVQIGGETYESDFLTLLQSPEIDEVVYREKEDCISMTLSTHNSNLNNHYYMWNYEEEWQYHAKYDLSKTPVMDYDDPTRVIESYVYDPEYYPGITEKENPYYYCFRHQDSQNINIYSTDDLTQNEIKEHELLRIPYDDQRISYVYSLFVKQFLLNKEAYTYYKTMKLYTEESDGLFTPMPSALRGNIRCVSNPDIKIRGMILASTVTTKRIFVIEKNLNHHSTYNFSDENCELEDEIPLQGMLVDPFWKKTWQYWLTKYGHVAVMPGKDALVVEDLQRGAQRWCAECVDCTHNKGNVPKPSYWPEGF